MNTWVEVDKIKLRHNYELLRQSIGPQCSLMAVVKSNAYGHGMVDFSLLAQEMGVDWFAVGPFDEALELRKKGIIKPILVFLGSTDPEILHKAVNKKISLTISDFKGLEAIKELSQQDIESLRIHLKIDTGMHRQGFFVDDVSKVIQFFKENKISQNVIEGVYTHFATAEDPSDRQDTIDQLEQFRKAVAIIKSAGFKPLIHAATTTSTFIFPESRFNLVRVGAGLYGIWPSPEAKAVFCQTIPLQPILSWKTVVNEIKCLPKGSRIGYGFTKTLKKDSTVALCPVGYYHGYRRHLSNAGQVLINGHRADIVGRVAMYFTTIDISNIPNVKIGQEVTLIGKDCDQEITLEAVASWTDALNKEIICEINPLIPRRYV